MNRSQRQRMRKTHTALLRAQEVRVRESEEIVTDFEDLVTRETREEDDGEQKGQGDGGRVRE